MPAPIPRTRFIRPFATHVLNPFMRLFVHRLPGFAVISYRGRKSGKAYRTPLNVFRDGDDYIFALTYGSQAEWVRNVLAAGSAELQVGRKTVHVTDPEVFVDPKGRLLPLPVRMLMRPLRVSEFLRMRPVPTTGAM